jgi:hypothetical protein
MIVCGKIIHVYKSHVLKHQIPIQLMKIVKNILMIHVLLIISKKDVLKSLYHVKVLHKMSVL